MLIDKIRVNLKSGMGGNGAVKFFKTGKPAGGNGGNGGDIYLEGTQNIYDLKPLLAEKTYRAENGKPGEGNTKKGAQGKDLTIKVPLTTIGYSLENEEIFRISEHGQRILMLKGSIGGLGNYEFRRGQASTHKKSTPGKPGREIKIFLELNLSADIIFIGFPNAGKSSMLNALTNASVAVASYPFTTLQPHLGVAEDMMLMDLPGLIEGTYEGKGLGTRFVKHTQKAKVVAHFVSLESEDVVDTYQRMRDELKNISGGLDSKKEIVLLTKSDMYTDEEIENKRKSLSKHIGSDVHVCSAFKLDELKEVIKFFRDGLS